jgi:hypothetical protein
MLTRTRMTSITTTSTIPEIGLASLTRTGTSTGLCGIGTRTFRTRTARIATQSGVDRRPDGGSLDSAHPLAQRRPADDRGRQG